MLTTILGLVETWCSGTCQATDYYYYYVQLPRQPNQSINSRFAIDAAGLGISGTGQCVVRRSENGCV